MLLDPIFFEVFPPLTLNATETQVFKHKPKSPMAGILRWAWQNLPSITMLKTEELAKYLKFEEVKKYEWH